ncbi:hypothetical protein GCM10009654_12690 [Streptomyces hebeiensis]|uniref:Uncharacterized protein n=1 Tax=Streptomyces hebeiensis TaxID=229486 RepID=A0ABP4F676_9ACTN
MPTPEGYRAPTAEDAPFLPELTAAAAHRPELRLHPTFSRSHGRLTTERIQGVPRQHLHAEHFAFR